jgi:translation initiation factor IF-2
LAIRIYALAKELEIDNKKLVDICARAGITGKGSALASLTDEEEVRVRGLIAAGKSGKPEAGPAKSSAAAPRSIRREDYIAPAGAASGSKIPVLPSSKPEKPPLTRKKPEEPAPEPIPVAPVVEAPSVAPPAPVAPLSAVVKAAVGEPAAPPPPEKPAAPPVKPRLPAAQQPQPPLAPQRPAPSMQGPLQRLLGNKRVQEGKPGEKKPSERKPPEKSGPAIHLAPLPAQAKTPLRSKPKEPAPQKPEIRLPPDAIRGGKGSAPLSEQLRKHEEKKRRDDLAAKKGGPRPGAPAAGTTPLGPLDLPSGKDRPRRGVGRPGVVAAEDRSGPETLGGREQRQLKRKRPSTGKRGDDDDSSTMTMRKTRIQRKGTNTAAPRKGKIIVETPITIRALAEATGISPGKIQGKLLTSLQITSPITASLDAETVQLLAAELGVEIEVREKVSLEQRVVETAEQADDPELLQPRPPIVTVLGHVDHGKTSLLDRIIGLDVAAHEKGGITQHIRAYKVQQNGGAVTFVDTPGHEAFTEMRARGANVTDIAVLVVAADDGVMPQTEEAISHARAAGVPIVVALNKIDLPGINQDRIFNQLAENQLLPSEWGGDTEVVKTSATKGTGIDELLSTLLTVAELHDYKANPDRSARGTCLEAEMHEDRGVIAKVLVQNGTLHAGDIVVCGGAYGRVKAMYDTLKPHIKYEEAGPSTPVNITGLNVAPGAGDIFYVLDDISQARALADQRLELARQRDLSGVRKHVTLETLFETLGQIEDQQTLSIILRADVRGSIEAIRKEIGKLTHPEVQIRILQATVGGITEADVHLADASDAVIIGFNVVPDEKARVLADERGVQIRRYDIIYQVADDLRAALEGMLKPEKQEKELGRVLVQQVFKISRVGAVAGCRVLSGTISRDARVRLIRENRIVGDYALDSLRREKDDAREVREGLECGIKLAGFNDVKEGDIFEAYKIEEIKRTFAETAAAT